MHLNYLQPKRMINDNTQDTERTQRTFRPQERTREKELVRENESQQPGSVPSVDNPSASRLALSAVRRLTQMPISVKPAIITSVRTSAPTAVPS